MSSQANVSEKGVALTSDALDLDGRSLRRLAHEPSRPRPQRIASWSVRCLLLDVTMLGIASAVILLGATHVGFEPLPARWVLALAGTALLLYAARGAYSWRMRLDVVEQARLVLTQTAVAGMVVLAIWALSMPETIAVGTVFGTWLSVSAFVLSGRLILDANEVYARRNHRSLRPTLIVGTGAVATWLARRLLEHPEFGLRPLGFIDDDPPITNGRAMIPVLGRIRDLESVAAEQNAEQIIITFSRAPHDDLLEVIDRCSNMGLPVALVPRLFERTTRGFTLEHVGGLPLIRVRPAHPRGWYFRVKYAIDPLAAGLTLLLVLPMLASSALAVWVSVGRPIFFRQSRVGRDGKLFVMLKFRTMRAPDEEVEDLSGLPPGMAPGGVEGAEDRRTRVGRFLRATSLDELPQLINVLRGEMSLVGPRPERPEFVRGFSSSVRGYDRRHRVKSGITGWSQVNGLRGQTSISDRAEYDNYYIENFSLWLDLKILVLTFLTVLQAFLHTVLRKDAV